MTPLSRESNRSLLPGSRYDELKESGERTTAATISVSGLGLHPLLAVTDLRVVEKSRASMWQDFSIGELNRLLASDVPAEEVSAAMNF